MQKHSKNQVIVKTLSNKNASKEDLDVLGKKMIEKLDKTIDLDGVSEIVIENQPFKKSKNEKYTNDIIYILLIKRPEIKLRFVSADSKLNFKIENDKIKEINKIKDKYQKGKVRYRVLYTFYL